jgi:hypothetical protein
VECPACSAEFPAVATEDPTVADGTKGIARFLAGIYEPADGAERAWLIGEAKWLAKKPGNGLIVIGLLGMLVMTASGLGYVFSGVEEARKGVRGADGNILGGLLLLTTGNFYCFVVAAGGRSLKRLEHPGLCFTSATLAMFSVLPCGGWLVLSIPAVIFATWAFAVLRNPVVFHAMQWIRNDREQSRGF